MTPVLAGRAAPGRLPRMRTLWLAAVGIFLVTVYSCDTLTPEESQYLIEFGASDLQLELGQTVTVPAELTRGGLNVIGEQVSYISSAPTIVSVDGQGTLRAIGLGSASITATAQSESATLAVTVVNGPPATLTANRQLLNFSALTDTARVTVQARNRYGVAIPSTVNWSSHNPGVATVTSTGLVRSVTAGATQVIAATGSLVVPVDVVVSQQPGGITIRTPNEAPPVVRSGQSVRLSAVPVDRLGNQIPGTEATVVWSSDDPSIATVDPTGVVRGISAGRTRIRARTGVSGAPAAVDVPPSEAVFEIEVVAAQVGSVSVSPSFATMDADEQLQLTATVRDTDGNVLTDRAVIWTTTNADVATVTSTGRVTARGAGPVTIRATVEGRSATSSITVSGASTNNPPGRPTLTVTAITATTATLNGSAFSDPNVGDSHALSHWQVDEDGGDWSTPVLDVTSSTDRTSRAITGLSAGTAYQARVRYQDDKGNVSPFSVVVDFSTNSTPPNAPTVTVNAITSSGATLNGSPFTDPDAGNTHLRTNWQVDEQGGDWSTPVINVTNTTSLTSRVVNGLTASTNYQARARYQDNNGTFSAYSATVNFSTIAPPMNTPPAAPTVTITAIGATTATLNGSAFSDPDAGNTHAQTQWQVDELGGDWSTPVFNLVSATNLTSRAVTILMGNSDYQARARYQDNNGSYGAYSATVTFSTTNRAPNAPTVSVTAITATGATLNGTAFSDPDVADTHAQTQWQVDEQGGDWSTPVFDATAATNLTSRAVTGLLSGTTYQARARYQDGDGLFGAYSATESFTTGNTPPNAPTVTVTNITSTGVTLNGSAFSDADPGDTHDRTQWLIDEQGGDWSTPVFTVTNGTDLTTRVVTGLLPGTNYQARARYRDNHTTFSAYSATVNFATANTAPNAPTVTVNAITSTGATLNGSAFSDPDAGNTHAQTQWMVDEQGGDWSTPVFTATAATNLTSRAVTGLLPHTNYQARARYQDNGGTFSAYSATVNFSTTNTAPAAPTVTVNAITTTGATLNGTAFSDADAGDTHAQTQWMVDEQGGDWSTPVFTATAATNLTSRAVTGLLPHTNYQARARYQDNGGTFSAYSATVNFSTTNTAPAAPTVTVNAITTTGATLNGTAFSDADAGDTHAQTEWQVDEQGGDWSTTVFSSTGATNLTSRAVTGLLASTNYQARARYQDSGGTFGAYSATANFTTSAVPANPPNAPTVTVNAITSTGATLNGSAFSDPDAGNTHAQTQWMVDEQGGDWSTPVFTATAATNLTSRAVTGLLPHTDYQARARYQDNGGTFSAYSATVNFSTTNTAPAAPTVTVNAITSTGATLNGTAFSDADAGDTHAQTQWMVDEQGGDWSTPVFTSTAATNLTSRAITGLLASTNYQARARYQDSFGTFGAYSTTVNFTTSGNNPPNAPTVTVNGLSSTGATLNGSAFSDPDGGDTHAQTEWQVDEQGGDWSTTVFSSTGATNLTSRAVTGLLASTNYQARARYQDSFGTFGAFSTTVNFTTTAAGGTILFASNWDHATGTSRDAVEDGAGLGGRRWSTRFCSANTDVANVIAGDGVGWTLTDNVLEITRAGTSCTQVEAQNTPGWDVGEDFFVRMYVRNDATAPPEPGFPDGANASNHPVCMNCLGSIQATFWAPQTFNVPALPAGVYKAQLFSNREANIGNSQDARWIPNVHISNGVWYRFEYHVEFVTTNVPGNSATIRIWPRIYDMAGSLVHDATSFLRGPGWGGDPAQTLAQFYASGETFPVDALNITNRFGVGYEGPGGATNTGQHWYYAGVAVGTGDWLGGL